MIIGVMKNQKIMALAVALLMSVALHAQEDRKFSPEKFEADLTAYITREAQLSQQECEAYFPLLKEMHTKQREIYARMRAIGKNRPTDEKGFADAVKTRDKLDIELKQIEQQYHQKMLKVVDAAKVYDAIKAESRFHRQMMKNWQRPSQQSKRRDRRH